MTELMSFRFGDDRIAINAATADEVLGRVRENLDRGRGFALATVNLDHLVKLRQSTRFRAAYADQTIVVADGKPIVWLSRLAGRPVALVPGSDLVMPLVETAGAAGAPIALVGATDDTLAVARATIEARVPGAAVVACIAPSMGFDAEGPEADAIIAQLGSSGARLCLLAIGAPRQEIFAARALAALPEMGFASIGAGLDFIAGRQTRAPLWMRRIAMEWLWRLLANPARLARRYLHCAAILPGLAVRAWRMRRDDVLPVG